MKIRRLIGMRGDRRKEENYSCVSDVFLVYILVASPRFRQFTVWNMVFGLACSFKEKIIDK